MTTTEEYTDSECEMLLCLRFGSMLHAALAYFDNKEGFTEQERRVIKPHMADAVKVKIDELDEAMKSWKVIP